MRIEVSKIDPPKLPLRLVKTWSIDFLNLRYSIKTHGILQEIIVRPKGDRFELVDGSNRFECARQLGFKTVPCKIFELTDIETLVLQVQTNSSYIPTYKHEYARHLKTILKMDQSLTLARLASALSKPVSWVRKILSLNKLDDKVAEQIKQKSLRVQLEMAKLPREIQEESISACETLSFQEFQSYVSRKLKSRKEALLYAKKNRVYADFQLKPSVRSIQQILKEQKVRIAERILLTDEDTAFDGWKKALDWVLHQDKLSRKEYIEKLNRLEKKKKEKLRKNL